jgi:hypothetical protein
MASGRAATSFALLLVVASGAAAACSRRAPAGPASHAVATATTAPSAPVTPNDTASTPGDAPSEELALPAPTAIGPLVPWMAASAWQGRGVPPKQFSIFAIPDNSPVLGYAALDRDACEAALAKRSVPFARADDTPGVRAPVRLTGPLHGVVIHSLFGAPDRARSRAELIDCRLALSLDDFAASLEPRGIVEVTHISAYRSKKEGGCTAKYAGEQHCAALALDVASFTKKDGAKLVVERDFHGKVGLLTCAEAPRNELWEIACASAGKQFQVVLTPNWNEEHKNHLHLELTVHDWVLAR